MKVIAFIESHQDEVIRKILQHCGLWQDPRPRPPPRPPPAPASPSPADRTGPSRLRHFGLPANAADLDPDFLEHLHREAQAEQLNLPWD